MHRGWAVVLAACAAIVTALSATGSAHSARQTLTASHITTPKDQSYFTYNKNQPNTFTVSGTSNGAAGSHVDILCYYGGTYVAVAQNVPVASNGSFTDNASLGFNTQTNILAPCTLAAVPSGTAPAPPTGFTGPTVLVGENNLRKISSGVNSGKLYDYYAFSPQLHGGMDYDSLGECGLDDGYLFDATFARTTITWYCNAALFNNEKSPGTRSEIQIDGVDAWTPQGAEFINPAAPVFPQLAYSYTVNPKTGDTLITEIDPLVKCADHTYPPTKLTCGNFMTAGVADFRTIVQNASGQVAWITDNFASTDHKSHKLDLLWDNDQRFYRDTGDSTQLEYKFPGQSGYSKHLLADVVNLPSGPGTMFVRMHGAPDGDTATGQGAMVYDRTATAATFNHVDTSYEAFTLHQTATLPAGGFTRFRFAYVHAFTAAKVKSLAQYAAQVFKGTSVPNVVGKTLAAAKKAIAKAHCVVGEVTHVHSAKPKGTVVSESPKAKTHVDYGTHVDLKVSKG